MKHHAPQFEMRWDKPEDFTLVPETALDGERITREREQAAAAKAEAEQKQERLFKPGEAEAIAEEILQGWKQFAS